MVNTHTYRYKSPKGMVFLFILGSNEFKIESKLLPKPLNFRLLSEAEEFIDDLLFKNY